MRGRSQSKNITPAERGALGFSEFLNRLFGGRLLGHFFRRALPAPHHLAAEAHLDLEFLLVLGPAFPNQAIAGQLVAFLLRQTLKPALEFLGDAVLQLIVTERLWKGFPAADEGVLTHLRSERVNGRSLAGVFRRRGLGEFLRLGKGEEKASLNGPSLSTLW